MTSRQSKSIQRIVAAAVLAGGASAAQAGPFMGGDWAESVCQNWNQSETLTTELAGDDWAANNGDKGYKVIQMYRNGCGGDTRVELNITAQDGKAVCTYGGPAKTAALDDDVDYLMHASDENWTCMGEGRFGCGAMGAMMSGKLQFAGPKMEAANVTEPFNAFLKLTGKVIGDESCPATGKTASR